MGHLMLLDDTRRRALNLAIEVSYGGFSVIVTVRHCLRLGSLV